MTELSEPSWSTDDLISYSQKNYGYGSQATYDVLAWKGGGPPFRKAGKFRRYDPPKARAWLEGRLSPEVTSTSELQTLRGAA